jgi:hypothetical protein
MIRAKEYSVTPPFHALPGDVIERDGMVARLKRNGATIATSTLGPATTLDSGDVTTRRVISSIFEAEEIRMSLSLTVADVIHEPDGSKTIQFPGGNGVNYQQTDFDQAVSDVNSIEWQMKFVLARYAAKSPDLSSDTSISGKTFEWNPASDLTPFAIGEI